MLIRAILVSLTLCAAAGARAAEPADALLRDAPHRGGAYFGGSEWIKAARWATADPQAVPAALSVRAQRTLRLNLFHDADFFVSARRLESPAPGVLTMVGDIEHAPGGEVTLVHRFGVTAAHVRTHDNRVFQLVISADGAASVKELDTDAMPGCAGAIDPEALGLVRAPAGLTAPGAVLALPEPECDDRVFASDAQRTEPPHADVLIAYTPSAAASAGGVETIEALLHLAVLDSNTVYEQSMVDLRIRPALIMQVSYTESGSLSTDLGRIAGTSDGFMDEVHPLRNTFGADLVALITGSTAGGACGVGYLMQSPSAFFASSAFSVTALGCIPNFTFTHELGHNMGCQHDRGNAGAAPSRPYAYGYRTPNNQYRTVMAYAPGTRVGRMSNPDVIFNGFAMGVPLGDPNETHNALTLSLNAPFITAWRGEQPVRITDLEANTGPGEVSLSWSALADAAAYRVYRDTSFQVLASGANKQGETADTVFVDATADPETLYSYWVVPVFPDGVGAISNVAQGFATVGVPGDISGDGSVDGTDLGLLLLAWGACPAPCTPDINGDGFVDGTDLGLLLLAWSGGN